MLRTTGGERAPRIRTKPHNFFVRSAAMVILTLAFGVVSASNPVIGQSLTAVFVLSLLFLISGGIALVFPFADRLHPLRLVSGLFLLTYCVAPQFLFRITWYFRGEVGGLLLDAAATALLALVSIAIGFWMAGMAAARPAPVSPSPRAHLAIGSGASLALISVAGAAYALLFVFAGGLERMLGGDESRVQFFRGFGALYHASFFVFPGAALWLTRATVQAGRFYWTSALPLLMALAGFMLLQGRLRALTAAVALTIAYHYLVRAIPRAWLLAAGALSLVAFLFVGYARDPEVRFLVLSRPWDVILSFAASAQKFATSNFGEPFNRLLQAMLVLDNVGDRIPYRWGATFLQVFDPFLRLIGQPFQRPPGVILFRLAQPGMGSLETGYHPSLVGEVLMNFPRLIAPIFFAAYGAIVQRIYSRLIVSHPDFLSVATYSVALLPLLSMVVVGVGQLLFELALVTAPLLALRVIIPRPSHASARG